MSYVLHLGALVVLASWSLSTSLENARFAGAQRVIRVEMAFNERQPKPPSIEIGAEPDPVIIMPATAPIAKRVFVESLFTEQPAEFRLATEQLVLADNGERHLPIELGAPPKAAPGEASSWASVAAQPPMLAKSFTAIRPPKPVAVPILDMQTLGTDPLLPPSFDGNRPPRYPELARQRGWEGTVLLRLYIAADGRVTEAKVEKTSGYPILDAAAVTTVRTWHGYPATRGGRPVATEELLPVRFAMR